MAQRVIEGGLFDNPRSGFGLLTGSAHGALNLFYLSGFPAIFISTYAVSCAFGLCRA
jgi:hypothetical protein